MLFLVRTLKASFGSLVTSQQEEEDCLAETEGVQSLQSSHSMQQLDLATLTPVSWTARLQMTKT